MKKFLKEQNTDRSFISEKVWQNGVIVFDTNVLLNLYRYNEETRNELLKLMKSYQNRLWMPYQVALEFLANCEAVKTWLHKGYKELTGQVDECKKSFFKFLDNNFAKHKHINREELVQLFDQQLQPIKDKLSEWEMNAPDFDKDDVVKNKILSMYDKRVGNDYNCDELLEIYAKGKIRYENKIPPGYKDDTRDKREMGGRHVYGDLIVWMQIMDYAEANKKDVIFVGEDLKEDWWEKDDGKINKPRQELLDEFRYRTGREIVFHTQKRFIEASKKKLKEETLKDIERVRDENLRFLEQIRNVRESMPQVPRFVFDKHRIPTYDEIQTSAMSHQLKKLQESLKGMQEHIGAYGAIADRMKEVNGDWIPGSWMAEKK